MAPDIARLLQERGAHFQVVEHAATNTGVEEAVALGIPCGDVLKAVLVDTSSGHALAVIPADRRLDMQLLREAIGDKHAHLATEEEISQDLPGFQLGCLPPLGSLLNLPMYVDPDILRHPEVTFAAGTRTESVKGPTEEIFSGELATVAQISVRWIPVEQPVEAY